MKNTCHQAVSAAIRGPTVIITTIEANATGKKLGSKPTSIAFSPKRSVLPSSRINLDRLRLARIANETIPALLQYPARNRGNEYYVNNRE